MREARVSPRKSLGQHFLTDWRIVSRIVEATRLTGGETVIEVGPGLGVLTERLAAAAGRLFAVEIDPELATRLRENLADRPSVSIVEADALTVEPESLVGDAKYGVVGNLPYNAGTAILRHFLESKAPPAWLVVMLQREVVESIVAAPGRMSLVGVSVQVYAEARMLFAVPSRAFYPPPKVRSAVLRLDVREQPLVPADERERFFEVVRAGFSTPRKQVRNSLVNGLRVPAAVVEAALSKAGIDPSLRPAALSIDDWVRLARAAGARRGD